MWWESGRRLHGHPAARCCRLPVISVALGYASFRRCQSRSFAMTFVNIHMSAAQTVLLCSAPARECINISRSVSVTVTGVSQATGDSWVRFCYLFPYSIGYIISPHPFLHFSQIWVNSRNKLEWANLKTSKMSINTAHYQKISNALSTSRQYLNNENVETQCWLIRSVWQRIPGRRACSSKPCTDDVDVQRSKTIQTIGIMVIVAPPVSGSWSVAKLINFRWLADRPQMLKTNNVGRVRLLIRNAVRLMWIAFANSILHQLEILLGRVCLTGVDRAHPDGTPRIVHPHRMHRAWTYDDRHRYGGRRQHFRQWRIRAVPAITSIPVQN